MVVESCGAPSLPQARHFFSWRKSGAALRSSCSLGAVGFRCKAPERPSGGSKAGHRVRLTFRALTGRNSGSQVGPAALWAILDGREKRGRAGDRSIPPGRLSGSGLRRIAGRLCRKSAGRFCRLYRLGDLDFRSKALRRPWRDANGCAGVDSTSEIGTGSYRRCAKTEPALVEILATHFCAGEGNTVGQEGKTVESKVTEVCELGGGEYPLGNLRVKRREFL